VHRRDRCSFIEAAGAPVADPGRELCCDARSNLIVDAVAARLDGAQGTTAAQWRIVGPWADDLFTDNFEEGCVSRWGDERQFVPDRIARSTRERPSPGNARAAQACGNQPHRAKNRTFNTCPVFTVMTNTVQDTDNAQAYPARCPARLWARKTPAP
jgi:hypothetical protein